MINKYQALGVQYNNTAKPTIESITTGMKYFLPLLRMTRRNKKRPVRKSSTNSKIADSIDASVKPIF